MNDEDRNTLRNLLLLAHEHNKEVVPTGSRVIGGATEDSDYDYVMRFGGPIYRNVESIGFVQQGIVEGEYDRGDTFVHYRCGNINLISAYGANDLNMWKKCTEVATAMKPRTKEERTTIFEAIRTDQSVVEALGRLRIRDYVSDAATSFAVPSTEAAPDVTNYFNSPSLGELPTISTEEDTNA
jgi:hypothetical protein